MAQRDITSAGKESTSNKPMTQRPKSIKLETSLSQPAPLNPKNAQTSSTRRHMTLPVPLNHSYYQSPAERYIASLSEMVFSPTNQEIISPVTPTSILSSPTKVNISLIQAPMGHAERMSKWRQEKSHEICKKQKYRYTYGTPPSSSTIAFPSPMKQLNSSSSSQRDNIKSSIPSPTPRVDLAVKTEELTSKKTEKSKTNETYNVPRISTAV